MTPADALAWICARQARYLANWYDPEHPGVTEYNHVYVNAAHEVCLMLAGDDLPALRAVWGRWVAFRWAVEHPEDPVLVAEEEGP